MSNLANPKLDILFKSLRILFKDKVRGVSQDAPANYCVGAGVLRLFHEINTSVVCSNGFPDSTEMAKEMVKIFPSMPLHVAEKYCGRIIQNNDSLHFEQSWQVVEEMLTTYPNSLVSRCMDLQLAEDVGLITPLPAGLKEELKDCKLL